MILRIFVMLILIAGIAAAETYVWTDNAGTINFTDNYSDIPSKYHRQVQIFEHSPDNDIPGDTTPQRENAHQKSYHKPEVEPAIESVEDGLEKRDTVRGHKKNRYRHNQNAPVIIETTPARRAQNRVDEQLRRDRSELDNNLDPARRAMDQNERIIRKNKNSTSGH